MDLPPDYDDKIIERPRDKATKAVDQPPEEVRHFGVKRTRDEDEFDEEKEEVVEQKKKKSKKALHRQKKEGFTMWVDCTDSGGREVSWSPVKHQMWYQEKKWFLQNRDKTFTEVKQKEKVPSGGYRCYHPNDDPEVMIFESDGHVQPHGHYGLMMNKIFEGEAKWACFICRMYGKAREGRQIVAKQEPPDSDSSSSDSDD